MVLYASDFDVSNYLKAADLGEIGSEKRVKILKVTKEVDVGEEKKTKACVWFTNIRDRGLLLNKTNLRTLQGAFGNSMEVWPGKIVVLFSIMADFRGQMTPALRVRIPPPKDDYRAPPAKPTPPKRSAQKRPVDDEIEEDLDRFDDSEQLDDDISDVR